MEEKKEVIDIEKLKKEIEQMELQEHTTRDATPITAETKLSILWAKVQPFVMLLSAMVKGRIKIYLNAFTAAINELVKKQEEEEHEEEVAQRREDNLHQEN